MKVFRTIATDHSQYDGLAIRQITPMDESEYDKDEVGPMFNLILETGQTIQAFSDEIKEE